MKLFFKSKYKSPSFLKFLKIIIKNEIIIIIIIFKNDKEGSGYDYWNESGIEKNKIKWWSTKYLNII